MGAGRDRETPIRPAGHSSRWTINWVGALPLLLIVVIAVIAWRWLDGAGVASQDDPGAERGASSTSEPVDPDDEVAAVTAPRPATTTNPIPPSVSSSTTTVVTERRVLISGEMRPCRYGSNCLVASFTIEGFEPHPGRFVCVYPNSRSDFGFGANGVDDACLTGDQGDTITIEVDGVRSATISEQNLDGTEPSN